MRNKNLLKTIIVFLIVLFFCILCFLFYLMKVASSETTPKVGTTIIRQEEQPQNTTNKNEKDKQEEEKKVEITKRLPIHATNPYLSNLISAKMGTYLINSILDEGIELDNGYTAYNDGTIEIRTTLIGTVRNIIFTNKYDGNIVRNVNLKTSLKEILELYPEKSFGSLEDDYLGYLTNDFYYFFYDDEISVYGYTYEKEEKFEKF